MCIRLNLMPLKVYRLRRWLAALAVIFTTVVAGMYLYARLRQHSGLKEVPGRISYDVKQTASGFQFSKSEAGRTLFTIRAGSVKEFKLNGRADLHQVSITLYGRGTSRFDRISGDDFSFDPKTGQVVAQGEVQIDLEANPAGLNSPDQSSPKDLKSPIHLNTRDLVFNRDSGDAFTRARVDFQIPQAAGSAVGLEYSAKSATLTLDSQIRLQITGDHAADLSASHATITREPREITLDHPRMKRASGILQAGEAIFFLDKDNQVEKVIASDGVSAESSRQDSDPLNARADYAELLLNGKENFLRTATLRGNLHVERFGSQPMQGEAGRARLEFRGQNELQAVHASEGVHLSQHAAAGGSGGGKAKAPTAQDFDLNSPAVDFLVAGGSRLDRAQTLGPSQIVISSVAVQGLTSAKAQRTAITAARFDAKFVPTTAGSSRLSSIHGAPDAKIVSFSPGVPDRVSTSQTLDATFLPQGGIASITQKGSVAYSNGLPREKRTEAFADTAVYTPVDQILTLTGNPRVTDGGMSTTANTIRVNRVTDDDSAEGDVKSTYSDLKVETEKDPVKGDQAHPAQANGGWLPSSLPIHITAATMTAHNSPPTALYQGHARLWQDANMIEAYSVQFDRDHRSLIALGAASHPVTTVLTQAVRNAPPKSLHSDSLTGNAPLSSTSEHKTKIKERLNPETEPITITSARLTYSDDDRLAHYEGDVIAKGTGFRAASDTLDVFFLNRRQNQGNYALSGPSSVDHMVARGHVTMQQPGRHAEGETLFYIASEDKFILTGGPPSIFDAEHGKITGGSLTFYKADDRVLVEGKALTPVVTQTPVTR